MKKIFIKDISQEERKEKWTLRFILYDDPEVVGWTWCMFKGDKYAAVGFKHLADLLLLAERSGFDNIDVIADGSHEY